MADIVSPSKRSQMMAGIKSKDTKPEVLIRIALHRRGLRYRLHRSDLPGKPDLYLKKYKSAIFVHGCFWHGHDCKYFKLPKSNTDFWSEKISANQKRDASTHIKL
ncbi:MAG: DNA mismatch endonuclease Vsr [Sphingomonadaceae bacterium]|nr:DNA mismatch endonuclease Vsr [Sphingomonadaceae bacterium]